MAVATTAIVGAAIAAAGALVGNMQKNSEMNRELAKYGADLAAIDANRAQAQADLSKSVSSFQQTQQSRALQIEQNLQATQAEQQVAAAASGTTGQSVEVTQNQSEAHAGLAQGNLEAQEVNAMNRFDQQSRDIELQADAARRDLDYVEPRGQLLDVFSAGLRGFLMGR